MSFTNTEAILTNHKIAPTPALLYLAQDSVSRSSGILALRQRIWIWLPFILLVWLVSIVKT